VSNVEGDFTSAFPAVSGAVDRAAIARGNAVEVYELPGSRLLRTDAAASEDARGTSLCFQAGQLSTSALALLALGSMSAAISPSSACRGHSSPSILFVGIPLDRVSVAGNLRSQGEGDALTYKETA
jgi:hypothetical protein